MKEFAMAQEAYEQLLREYERYRQLSSEAAVTGQQLEQLKIQVDGADAKRQSLQRRLEDTKIKAPVGGIINQVFVKKGGVLGNGSPVCEIVNPSGLKVTAHVSKQELELLKTGQPVTLAENSENGNTSEGVVAGLGVKPDRTGLYPINISLPSKVSGINPGMLLNAEINVSPDPAIILPWRNIRVIGGERGVFIAVNNRAVFRKIVTGKTYNDVIEVISGVEEGALLITNGYQFLNNDDRLKIVREQL
jgi:membrane fusion protein, multidrug efflux system